MDRARKFPAAERGVSTFTFAGPGMGTDPGGRRKIADAGGSYREAAVQAGSREKISTL